jgi:hypothetical protein
MAAIRLIVLVSAVQDVQLFFNHDTQGLQVLLNRLPNQIITDGMVVMAIDTPGPGNIDPLNL